MDLGSVNYSVKSLCGITGIVLLQYYSTYSYFSRNDRITTVSDDNFSDSVIIQILHGGRTVDVPSIVELHFIRRPKQFP